MTDYKNTVFLPQTDFPMRGNLPHKEPEILAKWQAQDLDQKIYDLHRDTGEPFILHDGPPYANGHIHIGHALNKILKDIIARHQRMQGKWVPYIPGWDCHGLPIEWKIEEDIRKKGKRKEDINPKEFRDACRTYAAEWVDKQRDEFKHLGVTGRWDDPYITMDPALEAGIVQLFHALKDYAYIAKKPVLWSVVEETALAEAEVEYMDKTSTEMYVAFPVLEGHQSIEGASVVIWTTTPWTLPANAAVAYSPELIYLRVDDYIVAADCLDSFLNMVQKDKNNCKINALDTSILNNVLLKAPIANPTDERKLMAAGFVEAGQGTGFVHIAPAHGEDDFYLWQAKSGQAFPDLVDGKGFYNEDAPEPLQKLNILKKDTEQKIMELLGSKLLHSQSFSHSYPHSWRSKAPLIYRTTRQFFLKVEGEMRDKALQAIDGVTFYPPQGHTRLYSMVEGRGDWCISRQRLWGVPLSITVDSGKIHIPPALPNLKEQGIEAWHAFTQAQGEKIPDVLDVWFDSGATWQTVLQQQGLPDVADLYLEGSDQHRGWFQSSLLLSVAARGIAPYKAVLTHGFVLDEQGRKMSKSLGNVVAPNDVIKEYGADILRLWVVNSDYRDDVRISKNILTQTAEQYRKIRNTLRYLLGAIHGFSEEERVECTDVAGFAKLPSLEQYVLSELAALQRAFTTTSYSELGHFYGKLFMPFIQQTLSAFYLDVRKDSLYCDAATNPRRRACRTVMHLVYEALCQMLAPVLVFTADEAWTAGGGEGNIHLYTMPPVPSAWGTPDGRINDKVLEIRTHTNNALEQKRQQKELGSSLEAHLILSIPQTYKLHVTESEWAELCIVSAVTVRPAQNGDLGVEVHKATAHKCPRCWQYTAIEADRLCGRCEEVVG
jgi:isoleucyl-tRNA synthetase